MTVRLDSRDNCPLCHSTSQIKVYDFDRIPVVECSNCHFKYSAQTIPQSEYTNYYKDTFGSERHRKGQLVNARVNLALLHKYLTSWKVQSFLDVGCGYGYLVNGLSELGIAAKGIELSTQEADFARSSLRQEVFNGLADHAPFSAASMDVVGSFEVIEHVLDPISFVASLMRYVRPGGYLIIGTDNFSSTVCRQMGASFPKWIPHSHISHFDGASLLRVMQKFPELRLVSVFSYTPWELELLKLRSWATGVGARRPFNLEETLRTEMAGSYRFFGLRQVLNPVWAKLTAGASDKGAMIYLVAQKGMA